MAQRGPGLAPRPSRTLTDEDLATLLLVVELDTVVDGRRESTIRELGRGVVEAEDDHRARRAWRCPEPRVGVVSRERTRESVGGAEAIDPSRLAVVPGEDDGAFPLRGRKSLVYASHGADELRPTDRLDRVLVDISDRTRVQAARRDDRKRERNRHGAVEHDRRSDQDAPRQRACPALDDQGSRGEQAEK